MMRELDQILIFVDRNGPIQKRKVLLNDCFSYIYRYRDLNRMIIEKTDKVLFLFLSLSFLPVANRRKKCCVVNTT
jgi:hypothetical protein